MVWLFGVECVHRPLYPSGMLVVMGGGLNALPLRQERKKESHHK